MMEEKIESGLTDFIIEKLPHIVEAKIISLPFREKALYIQVRAPSWDRPLIITIEADGFELDDDWRATVKSMIEVIEFWEYVGSPSSIEISDTAYIAHFTQEQEKKMISHFHPVFFP